MKLISFRISGAFAAFRDPSITSNQTVYYIPSKSAVVGMLGAMIGIPRSTKLDNIYGKEYLEFFESTKIGIQFETQEPRKVTFFTNHRSLKNAKTKPFKTELVENPKYRIYVNTSDVEKSKKLIDTLMKNEFVFSPYLGHVYCPASVCDVTQIDAQQIDPDGQKTQCVMLDESDTYNIDFKLKLDQVHGEESSVIIERHIHHFFNNNKFDGRVLKHWIPTKNSTWEIERISDNYNLSSFYKIGDHVICMY
ncbi:MAG: CRISPR-associated protein Cas5 [Nitrosopumilus sp.]|nr:CRISPR-associated protein Cas5 [Nitrosopumilus sp.]